MGALFGDSLSASVGQYLQLFDAAGQLSQQPDATLMATMELFSTAGAVVTPLQKARMMALCRPLHPDVGTIVREGLDHYGLLEPAGAGDASAAAGGEGGGGARGGDWIRGEGSPITPFLYTNDPPHVCMLRILRNYMT